MASVQIGVRLTPAGVRASSPRYAAFLEKYAAPIRASLVVADTGGTAWWTLTAADRLWTLRLRLRDGHLVPLDGAGFEGAWVRDRARDTQESEALMRTTLSRLAQRGELHQVVKDLFYPPHTIHRLAAIARGLGASGDVTAAAFRDATQLGRKRAIQVLEYFDRVGLLRRTGDVHRLRSDTDLFKGPA